MNNNPDRVLRGFLLTSTMAALIACGGGSDDAATPAGGGGDNPPPKITLTGVVADGYLAGADVCLDTDGDNSCVGEATLTQTDENGNFSLDATEADIAQYPVVSEVVEGITTDTDRITAANPTGVIATGEGYTLSSPPGLTDADGKPFVSPLTTLAENERQRLLKDNPDATDTTATALTNVAEKLGISASDAEAALTADYVADAQSTDPVVAEQAEQLHVVAQVTAQLLADAEADIEAAIAAGDLSSTDSADAILAALDSVSEQLDEVSAQVDALLAELASQTLTDAAREAALDAAIENTVNANDVVDAETIADVVEIDNAPTDALTAADMLKLEGGVWLTFLEDSYNEETNQDDVVIYVDNIAYIAETDTSIDDFYIFNPTTGGIDVELDDVNNDTFAVLTDSGWALRTAFDEHATWQLNEDGSVAGNDGEDFTLNASVTAVDVSGQSISSFMALYKADDDYSWINILNADAVFSADTTAYLFSGEDSDGYEIYSPDNNFVQVGPSFDNAGSLGQLVSSVDITITDGVLNSDAIYLSVGDDNDNVNNQFIAVYVHLFGGEATYFQLDHRTGLYSNLVTASYSTVTVKGEDILQLDIPATLNIRVLYWSDSDDATLKYSVYDGFVRHVEFEAPENFTQPAFNEAARDDLLAAVDSQILPYANELPDNLKALASVSVATYPDQETLYYAFEVLPNLWLLAEASLRSNGEFTQRIELTEALTSEPFLIVQEFMGNYSRLFGRRVATSKALVSARYDEADNVLIPPSALEGVRTFGYISAADSSGAHTVYSLCGRTVNEIDTGDLVCGEATGSLEAGDFRAGVAYMSTDKATIEALIVELNPQQSKILGSWLLSEGAGKRNVLTFIDEQRYIIIHEHADEPGVVGSQAAGTVEYGNYSWNESNGEFSNSLIAESDGSGGLYDNGSNIISSSVAVEDDLLTARTRDDGGTDVQLTRITSDTNPLIGGWIFKDNVLVFLSETEYSIAHWENTESYGNNQAEPLSGEFGIYSLVGNGFTVTSAGVDTDGEGGLFNAEDASDQAGETLTIDAGSLTFTDTDEGETVFERIGG